MMVAKAYWLFRNPVRYFRAFGVCFSDPTDSLAAKLKLVYKLLAVGPTARWAREQKYDHIHAHFASDPATHALFLQLLTGISMSFTGHAADLYRDPIALRPKLKKATGLVVISKFNLNFYQSVVDSLAPHRIVHCGIDLKGFPYSLPVTGGEHIKIFGVGRMVAKKGFRYLVQALSFLDRTGVKYRAEIAGDGPLQEELEIMARSLNLKGELVFLGAISQAEIKSRINQAGVFVLPSVPSEDGDVDGIPVALMEAMALGCPVISTRVSGIPELVQHEETGLLVEPRDAEGLAESLVRVHRDQELAEYLAQRGRKMVEEQFNIEKSAEQLESFFRELSASHPGGNP